MKRNTVDIYGIQKAIDESNRQFEESQEVDSWIQLYDYEGVIIRVRHYSCNPRTYRSDGVSVAYSHQILVHGVVSSEYYFRRFGKDMAELGISSSVIELPRLSNCMLLDKDFSLLDWQVNAISTISQKISKDLGITHDGRGFILGGHSRGGKLAVKAASQLSKTNCAMAGLLLLAPAGFHDIADANRFKAVGLAAKMGAYALRHPSAISQHAPMIVRTVAKSPLQSYLEIDDALSASVINDLIPLVTAPKPIPVMIITANADEFISERLIVEALDEHKLFDLMQYLAISSVSSNHMLGIVSAHNVISNADPNTVSGKALQFNQALAPEYSPLAINGDNGSVARLTRLHGQR